MRKCNLVVVSGGVPKTLRTLPPGAVQTAPLRSRCVVNLPGLQAPFGARTRYSASVSSQSPAQSGEAALPSVPREPLICASLIPKSCPASQAQLQPHLPAGPPGPARLAGPRPAPRTQCVAETQATAPLSAETGLFPSAGRTAVPGGRGGPGECVAGGFSRGSGRVGCPGRGKHP